MNNQQNGQYSAPSEITKEQLPPQFRPLSAWAYFGYSLLFSIPIAGFICLIVFSFNSNNINRRSFARSYFCMFIIFLIIVATFAILISAGAITSSIFDWLRL